MLQCYHWTKKTILLQTWIEKRALLTWTRSLGQLLQIKYYTRRHPPHMLHIKCMKLRGTACISMIVASLWVRSFSINTLLSPKDIMYSRTLPTSQEHEYLGCGGLLLKLPSMSLDTRGCFPITVPSMGGCVIVIAERYEFNVLYCFPSANSWAS